MCRENKFWLISWTIVAIYFSFDSYMDYKTKQAEIESIEEIEQTIKTIDDCAGDESDCRIMYEKLYKLINGEER